MRLLYGILDIAKSLGILLLIIMFIQFNKVVAENAKAASDTTQATRGIVTRQDETLSAIKDLAMDNKVLSEEKTNIIICMLQVPVEQRTTDVLTKCRRDASNLLSSQPAPLVQTPPKTPQNTQSNQNTTSPQNNQVDSPQPGLVARTLDDLKDAIGGLLNPVRNFPL